MENFKCEICNFKCSKRGDYNRHMNTKKHLNMISENKDKYKCEYCGKIYFNRTGLWRHKKKCKNDNSTDYKELYNDLLKQNNKLKRDIEMMKEKQTENERMIKTIIENMGTTTISQI